uniref:VWFA domain-containing protein n=1 Tax=Nothobranchius kuhntae TaxID=321403 RepID=A0A1A8IND8_NOTKU
MSLGLAMASDPMTQNTLACGPTIPKDCKSITMYKGLCFEIDPQNRVGNSYPPSTEECQNMADIAFLLDASGSVAAEDFVKMKTFVKNLISSFLRRETEATKFSVTQFSSKTTIHYYFDTFPSGNWKYHIDNLKQIIGATATAAAIKKVVSDVFSPDRGSRLKVKKILIVITDGQSTDSDLDKAIQLADNKDIARFSVGVGEAFTSLDAIKELKLIASQPSENFMFQVENFEALEKIQGNLQDRIFSIEGSKVSGETLKLEMSQEGSSEVKVGIDELLNVTVSVDNSGENSYNNHIILTYPVGLSYRKFTSLQGRIECNSLDSEDGVARGKTDCSVDKPIFKSNSKAIFIVSYGFNPRRSLDNKKKIFIAANATSGNQQHSASSNLYKKKEIGVKFSIFITIESSLSYNNFTIGKSNQQKTFQQLIEVTNSIRALTFTVVIRVPVKLRDKDIWMDMDSLQITDCERSKYEEPVVTDFAAQIKKTKVVDCSVARCRVFRCKRFMEKNEKRTHKISANLSSGWIEQIGLPSAKLLLTSTASLEYDANQYIFFSAASNYTPPVRKIEAEIEVFPEPDFTKEIIGGSLGGLLLLLLLTAGLYKAGFFKSKYNELMAEHVGEADPVNA